MNDVDNITEEQYLLLLEMFQELIDSVNNHTIDLEDLYDIIDKRAYFLYGFCANRFNLDIDEAIRIVKEKNERLLNPFERERRNCLVSALDNLIDFAIAAETQMFMDFENEEDEDTEHTFELYNKTYAKVENNDVDFASLIASRFISFPEHSTLMFTTQGDERVRDSHRALEGLSFPKSQFPEWLIPPIDWRCRCYLVESFTKANYQDFDDLDSKINNAVNPIFQESLAMGGRIFSSSHPYFTIDSSLKKDVLDISKSIKSKYNLI